MSNFGGFVRRQGKIIRLFGDGSRSEDARPDEGAIDPFTGVPYVRYETLYRTSHSSVTETLNTLATKAVVTFPEDEFLLHDFAALDKGGAVTHSALNLEKSTVCGIVGYRRTRFRLVEGSSTRGGTPVAPAQSSGGTTQARIIRSVDATGPLTIRNIEVLGTPQPYSKDGTNYRSHNYHALEIFRPMGPVQVTNVQLRGWHGDHGAPPGETSGLAVTMGSPQPLTIQDIDADGRFADSSDIAGTVGVHVLRAISPRMKHIRTHHQRAAASAVNYHTFDAQWEDCIFGEGSIDSPELNKKAWAFNGECNDGVILKDCTFSKANDGFHISHSNGSHEIMPGQPYTSINGSLTVINPTFTTPSLGNLLAIHTWQRGIDGQDTVGASTIPTPPTRMRVVDSMGRGQRFYFVQNTHHTIQSDDLPQGGL
ncbi:MAG: hypothetical protein QM708_12020 [Propioniciclava sp.]|uniref:hypothetical protein n=1 Tax=Propioniciclava sp. TaxID=2038686 RepID=UPI0039E2D0C6